MLGFCSKIVLLQLIKDSMRRLKRPKRGLSRVEKENPPLWVISFVIFCDGSGKISIIFINRLPAPGGTHDSPVFFPKKL